MNKVKLALALAALTYSASASAMPNNVKDSWYDFMYSWVLPILGNHR